MTCISVLRASDHVAVSTMHSGESNAHPDLLRESICVDGPGLFDYNILVWRLRSSQAPGRQDYPRRLYEQEHIWLPQ